MTVAQDPGKLLVLSTTDWNPLLRSEFDQAYWHDLQAFVAEERSRHTVYPPHGEVFEALHLTPYSELKVMILGQDPYHGPKQAHGLAFSVRPGIRIPPSLRNIHQELHSDLGLAVPAHGNLEAWARQGVLLLNTSLTVRAGQAGSHSGKGWEIFTDRVIDVAAARPEPLVFILWGNHARRKRDRIDTIVMS
jgi:uracil-DNA glycosylase